MEFTVIKEIQYYQRLLDIDTKYRSLYNQKSSKFKQLCPKALNENDYKKELRIILKDHKVT